MTALRCTICGVNWPHKTRYETCPECEGPTDLMGNATPLPDAEAQSRKNHVDFERFYEQREAAAA